MTEKNQTNVLRWDDESTQHKLNLSLNNDRVSIVSTDTVLGFLARPTKSGHDQLTRLKASREGKTYLVLISSPEKLTHFVDNTTLHPKLLHLLQQCWPGPVTVIFQARDTVAPFLCATNKTIGLRCPVHKGLQKLLASYEGLLSTSANFSGQPEWRSVDQIPPSVLSVIDYIVTDPNVTGPEQPSTIIDASGPTIRVVREGIFPVETLEKMYGEKFAT